MLVRSATRIHLLLPTVVLRCVVCRRILGAAAALCTLQSCCCSDSWFFARRLLFFGGIKWIQDCKSLLTRVLGVQFLVLGLGGVTPVSCFYSSSRRWASSYCMRCSYSILAWSVKWRLGMARNCLGLRIFLCWEHLPGSSSNNHACLLTVLLAARSRSRLNACGTTLVGAIC